MRELRIFFLFSLFAAFGFAQSAVAQPACSDLLRRPDGTTFRLMFGSRLGSNSDLAQLCLERIPVLKEVRFRASRSKELGDVAPDTVRYAVEPASGAAIAVIDIETWKTQGPDDVVRTSVAKLVDVIRTAKAALPQTQFGLYSMVPIRDYYRAIGDRGASGFAAWQAENNKLIDLAAAVDAVFPSVYTFFKEAPDRWARYARANVGEARRLAPNKPVYPFIWNRYHKTNEPLEVALMQAQLAALFSMKDADGVVLWLHSKETWDDSANWVLALRGFLEDRQVGGLKSTP